MTPELYVYNVQRSRKTIQTRLKKFHVSNTVYILQHHYEVNKELFKTTMFDTT